MVTSEENPFPTFVESLLNLSQADDSAADGGDFVDPLGNIPSVNTCLTKEALREHDTKLVRFDCQVVDMFEEEYFAGALNPNPIDLTENQQESAAAAQPLVYKYFTSLSNP